MFASYSNDNLSRLIGKIIIDSSRFVALCRLLKIEEEDRQLYSPLLHCSHLLSLSFAFLMFMQRTPSQTKRLLKFTLVWKMDINPIHTCGSSCNRLEPSSSCPTPTFFQIQTLVTCISHPPDLNNLIPHKFTLFYREYSHTAYVTVLCPLMQYFDFHELCDFHLLNKQLLLLFNYMHQRNPTCLISDKWQPWLDLSTLAILVVSVISRIIRELQFWNLEPWPTN